MSSYEFKTELEREGKYHTLLVEFDHWDGEPQTHDYPGCAAGCQITGVKLIPTHDGKESAKRINVFKLITPKEDDYLEERASEWYYDGVDAYDEPDPRESAADRLRYYGLA